MQTHKEDYPTVLKTLTKTYGEEGIKGLWKGSVSNCSVYVSTYSMYLIPYDLYLVSLLPKNTPTDL